MDRPFIPENLDQLTPDWVDSVLRERGFLDRAHVVGVEREILGDGEGFLGVLGVSRLVDFCPTSSPRSTSPLAAGSPGAQLAPWASSLGPRVSKYAASVPSEARIPASIW